MRRWVSACAAVLLAVSGCSSDPGVTAGPLTGGEAAVDGAVRVGLTEWDVRLDRERLPLSEVTLAVTNAGSSEHDLAIAAGERILAQTPMLAPGERSTLVLPPGEPGELTLWCTVPGHRSQGMHATLPRD